MYKVKEGLGPPPKQQSKLVCGASVSLPNFFFNSNQLGSVRQPIILVITPFEKRSTGTLSTSPGLWDGHVDIKRILDYKQSVDALIQIVGYFLDTFLDTLVQKRLLLDNKNE